MNMSVNNVDKELNTSVMNILQQMMEHQKPFLETMTECIYDCHKAIAPSVNFYIESMASAFEQIKESLLPVLQSYYNSLSNSFDAMHTFIVRDTAHKLHFYVSDRKILKKLAENTILIERGIEYQIVNFYSKNKNIELTRLMQEWEQYDFIQKRVHILNSCIETIRKLPIENAANVVIPTLFSQIDGMTKDLYSAIDPKICDKKYVKHHNILKNNTILNDAPFYVTWDIFIIIHYLFYFDKGIDFTHDEDSIFTKASDEQLENYVLNRNGVMHGSIYNYGTNTDLIRMVLCCDTMIKTISRCLSYIQEQTEKGDSK